MIRFKDFLFEDVNLNHQRYDLSSMYDEINAIAFNNELPRVKIKWSSRIKGSVGHAVAKFLMGKYVPGTASITISDIYDWEEDEVKSILAHEMIHIWMYINNEMTESHGPKFKKKMEEVSKKLGIKIVLTHRTPSDKNCLLKENE